MLKFECLIVIRIKYQIVNSIRQSSVSNYKLVDPILTTTIESSHDMPDDENLVQSYIYGTDLIL